MKHSSILFRVRNSILLTILMVLLAGCYSAQTTRVRTPASSTGNRIISSESVSSSSSSTPLDNQERSHAASVPLLPTVSSSDILRIAQDFKIHFIEKFQVFRKRLSNFFAPFFARSGSAKHVGESVAAKTSKTPTAIPAKPKPKQVSVSTPAPKFSSRPESKPKTVSEQRLAATSDSYKSIKFKYAKPGNLTKMRTHPSQVKDLKNVRKRNQIPKIRGVGFSFGRETVFKNNVALMKDSHYSSKGLKGNDLLDALEDYSEGGACIPTLLLAGHGWGSPIAVDGKKIDAIAKTHIDRNNGFGLYLRHPNASAVSVEGAISQKIKSKRINFCGECEVFVHACNISKEFAGSLSRVTGCRVVAADFQVSPVTPKPSDSWSSFPDDGRYDHVWFTSAKGNFFEYLPDGRRATIGKGFVFDPEP